MNKFTKKLSSLLVLARLVASCKNCDANPVEQSMISPRADYLILVDNFSSCFQ